MAEYIEREELIEAGRAIKLKDICPDYNVPIVAKALEQQGQTFLKLIKKAPTEDVEKVKHGEWIKHKPDPEAMKQWHDLGIAKGMSENSIFWTCSCCNGWGTPAHKYCSNCGAKMEKKEGMENG